MSKALPRFLRFALAFIAAPLACYGLYAQTASPRPLTLSGVYSVDSGVASTNAAFVSVRMDASKNLYLLLDEQDGIRVLKLDAGGTTRLASAHLGAAGDHGLALALDSSANVYVAGQSASGALTSTGAESFNSTPGGFVLQLTSSLATTAITATGGSKSSATGLAVSGGKVFVTGTIQGHDLPVTGDAIIPAFPNSSTTTGFLEIFSGSEAKLNFASYLGGTNGNTYPEAIAADTSGNAYITGYDTATGFPTLNAIQPEMIGNSDMFLTKLSQAAGLEFSTLLGTAAGTVEGSAIALAPSGGILTGVNATALGLPLTSELQPVPAATGYALVMGFAADGSAVNFSTALGDGRIRDIASISSSSEWVTGTIYDLAGWTITDDIAHLGNGFVTELDGSGNLLYSTRLGGLGAYASTAPQASTSLGGVAVASDGTVAAAGAWSLLASSSALATENLDLPYVSAPGAALPGTLAAAVAPSGCEGSSPSCSAGYIAVLGASATGGSLALSVDTLPNLTLRNTGAAGATVTGVSGSGYTITSDCATLSPLAQGAACNIAAAGNGPGIITATTSNAAYTWSVTGAALTSAQNPIAVQPKELLFPAAASAESQQQQVVLSNFTSQVQVAQAAEQGSEFTLADDTAATACSDEAYPDYTVNPGTDCTLLALFNDTATFDVQDGGKLGYATIQLSGQPVNAVEYYGYQLAAGSHGLDGGLVFSSLDLDFGTQYTGGLNAPRSVVVTNATAFPITLPFLSSPADDPNFSISDNCPAELAAHASCVLRVTYASAVTSNDYVSVTLPGSQTLTLTGTTLLPPGAGGLSVNPLITVSPSSLTFGALGVGDSTASQSVTISNSGSAAAAITIATTSSFNETDTCNGSVPANGSCAVSVTFTPAALGVLKGQLTVTPSGASPVAVALTGGGTADISFATAIAGTQTTQWISQGSYVGSISASVQGPYQVTLLNGYNFTAPPKIVFAATASGACTQNCYIGLRAEPAATGAQNGTLTITQGSTTTTTPLTGSALFHPSVVLSSYAISFAATPQYQASAPQVITVTNDSSAAASLGGIAVTSGFSETTACGSSLAAGASCAIGVTFTPEAPASFTGQLILTAGGMALTATLTGTSTADTSGLTFSPAYLVVPSPGGAYAQTVTITNTSSVSRNINSTSLGVPYSSFTESSGCGVLIAGGSCTITVKATSVPAVAQATYSLTIDVVVNGNSVLEQVPITLLPSAGGGSNGILQVTPLSLNFPPTAVSQFSNPEYLTVTNNSSATQAVTVSAPAGFSVDTTACATLAAAASCQVPVRFLPTHAGDNGANATLSGLQVSLGGYGIPNTQLAAPAYPPLIQPINAAALSITNAGTQPLTLASITGEAITANNCPMTVAVGASCTVAVLTTQGQGCGDSCTTSTTTTPVTVTSSADSSPDLYQLSQTLTGAQATATPLYSIDTASVTFAQTAIGAAASSSFEISSLGSAPVTFSLTTAGDFIATNNCAGSIAGSSSCTVSVRFMPTASGFRAGTLYVQTNAGSQTITLAGNGPASTGKSNTSTSLSASSYTVASGSTDQLTATVTSSGTDAPTGSVSFYYGSVNLGTATLVNGVASYTASTAGVPAGTYDLTATYSGDANNNGSSSPDVAVVITNTVATTGTKLSVSPQSAPSGSAITLTATVTRTTGSGNPPGTVSFLYGSTVLGSAPLASGTATFTLSTSGYAAGQYSITASYTGDAGDKPSTSAAVTITLTAALASTATVLSSSPASPAQGAKVTFTATVSGSGFIPTGSVTFLYGTTVIASTQLNSGVASVTASSSGLPAGSYSVTAKYSGSSTAASSVSNADVITLRYATATSVMSSAGTVAPGQKVTLTATVQRTAGSGVPAGNVTFYADGESLGSATLANGEATLTEAVPDVPAGTYQITAEYAGSSSDGGSTSAAANVTVQ